MVSTGRVMEKPAQLDPHQQHQQQQPPLRCPRCDSSNTKFCYYNNYSFSQPRHFCKACKRYWTRGGTLRNVPVGGGCRKNKRVKRPPPPSSTTNNLSSVQPQIELSSSTTSSNHVSPLSFYALHAAGTNNPSELSLPYPPFNSTVSNPDAASAGYDLRPQMDALGLGFSSGLMGCEAHQDDDYRNGLINPIKQIRDLAGTSSSLLPFFGSSTPTTATATASTTPTLASLLASGLHQKHKYMPIGLKDIRAAGNGFQGLFLPHEESQMPVNGLVSREGQNRVMGWNGSVAMHNQFQLMEPSDLWNSTNNAALWLDPPSNIDSSVPSLI